MGVLSDSYLRDIIKELRELRKEVKEIKENQNKTVVNNNVVNNNVVNENPYLPEEYKERILKAINECSASIKEGQ